MGRSLQRTVTLRWSSCGVREGEWVIFLSRARRRGGRGLCRWSPSFPVALGCGVSLRVPPVSCSGPYSAERWRDRHGTRRRFPDGRMGRSCGMRRTRRSPRTHRQGRNASSSCVQRTEASPAPHCMNTDHFDSRVSPSEKSLVVRRPWLKGLRYLSYACMVIL